MPETPRKVILFHTCIIGDIYPEVGMSVAEVLERLGLEVEVPPRQTCCGQPAYNAGFHRDARKVARHAVEVLSATEGPIVVPSGSCADMMVHQYPLLFEEDAEWREKARAVSRRCREFSQFLVEDLGVSDPMAALGLGRAAAGAVREKVAYHPSCHLLRGMGVRHPPRLLLEGLDAVECMPVKDQEECCGFGGMFSVKHAAISSAMLEDKLRNLEASGASSVVSCDMGCLMHLAGGLRRRGSALEVKHLSQALLEGTS